MQKKKIEISEVLDESPTEVKKNLKKKEKKKAKYSKNNVQCTFYFFFISSYSYKIIEARNLAKYYRENMTL